MKIVCRSRLFGSFVSVGHQATTTTISSPSSSPFHLSSRSHVSFGCVESPSLCLYLYYCWVIFLMPVVTILFLALLHIEVGCSNGELFLNELTPESTGTIVLMLCRMWDVNTATGRYLSTDFLMSDAKGNVIHCTAKATVAHNFLRLKEGGVYTVRNFVVMHNKEDFRVRKEDPFMIEFDGSTSIRKSLVISEGFVRHPFQFVDLDQIKPTDNKYLIDVAGYVTNVGRMNHTKAGSKNIDFYLTNQKGQSIRVTLWGGLADMLIEKKAKQEGVCAVVVTSTSARHYNNKLYLSSSSATQILDAVDIPTISALKKDTGSVVSSTSYLGAHLSEPKDGTIENLLMWARNRKNDSATFLCKAKIDDVRTRKGWNFPSCGGDSCKKGATRKGGRFWCDSCERPIEYPVIRYRLELGISDDTGSTVVVLFDEASVNLIKFPASALLTDEKECLDDHANLPSPILDLIGTTHEFEIKSHTYYEYGKFESFTCWAVDSPHPSIETESSSTIDNETFGPVASSKTLTASPSVVTPSKPTENKKKNRVEPEDSDVDDELRPLADVEYTEPINANTKATAPSDPTFKRLVKSTPAGDKKKKRADIEHSNVDIELISVDGDQDGQDDTTTDKNKMRRLVMDDSE